MNKMIIIMLLAITSILFSEETKKRIEITESDKNYGILDYIDDYYINEKLVRSELNFTSDYIFQNGRLNQIEYYNEKGQVIKYDSSYNQNYENYWGIKRVTEFMNDKNYEKIIYTFYNDSQYIFDPSHIQSIQSHGLVYLSSMINDYANDASEFNLKTMSIAMGQKFGSCVYINDIKNDTDNSQELEFIQDWITRIGKDSTSSIFKNTINIEENGITYKAFVLDQVYDDLRNLEESVIYGIYLGTLNNMPVTIIVGYNDSKK